MRYNDRNSPATRSGARVQCPVRPGRKDGKMSPDEATRLERRRCLACVENEPELPGDMPDEMWEAIRNDRDAMREVLCIAARITKQGIRERIEAA